MFYCLKITQKALINWEINYFNEISFQILSMLQRLLRKEGKSLIQNFEYGLRFEEAKCSHNADCLLF
jgi:hypothetical protein